MRRFPLVAVPLAVAVVCVLPSTASACLFHESPGNYVPGGGEGFTRDTIVSAGMYLLGALKLAALTMTYVKLRRKRKERENTKSQPAELAGNAEVAAEAIICA